MLELYVDNDCSLCGKVEADLISAKAKFLKFSVERDTAGCVAVAADGSRRAMDFRPESFPALKTGSAIVYGDKAAQYALNGFLADLKDCPFRGGKCSARACQLFSELTRSDGLNIGDCSFKWIPSLLIETRTAISKKEGEKNV